MNIAVNGSLMRGLALNQNLLDAGAVFISETRTAPIYRLWTVGDHYPAMLRDLTGGAVISVEIWEIDPDGLVEILAKEPPGLTVGRVLLEVGDVVFGILAEAYLVTGLTEITSYGGWRSYLQRRSAQS
jgi:gamma-glutamylcyclotransferase (GGCT)/AIG2-like uncharacterized protein YtfP